jgi:uncharacterized protein YfiM (DUF2279 family)
MATQESTLSLKKNNDVPSNATVTVASKFPMDFILRLCDFQTKHEPIMGAGSREYKLAEPRRGAKVFVVQGNSFPQNKGAHQQIVAGFALTHGIPKAFWDEWVEQNKDADFIVNKMLFAHGEAASAVAQSKEMEAEKSGLERLDPKEIHKHGLEVADERRAT